MFVLNVNNTFGKRPSQVHRHDLYHYVFILEAPDLYYYSLCQKSWSNTKKRKEIDSLTDVFDKKERERKSTLLQVFDKKKEEKGNRFSYKCLIKIAVAVSNSSKQ